ncbi:MAG TPA: NlpC/P60 family protein [Rhizomicrobium sp.]|nr:NlpC/P60 family protein [Rhizomicrobium sp.]
MSAKISLDERSKAEGFLRRVVLAPWRAGAQGPEAYDCWGLARAAQRELGGRDLPVVNADPADLRTVIRLVADHPMRAEWEEVATPQHLDLVLMAHSRHLSHIGVWLALDGGIVLHATEQFTRDGRSAADKPGVTADSLQGLRLQGFSRIQFMRHREAMA